MTKDERQTQLSGWWTELQLCRILQGLEYLKAALFSREFNTQFIFPYVNIYEIGICNASPVKRFACCWAEK